MKLLINDTTECVVELFDSISEFVSTIDRRTVNRAFVIRRDNLGSQQKECDDNAWYMTHDYQEADYLMSTGYREGYRKIMSKPIKVTRITNHPKRTQDMVGHAPIVANYIIGHPLQMVRTIHNTLTSRVVKIYYDRCVSSRVKAEEVTAIARYLYDAIRKIEADGVNVELYVGYSSESVRQTASVFIRVKSASAAINPMKMAYILVHPSFFRRQMLRWVETCPSIYDSTFSQSYGKVYSIRHSLETQRQMLIERGAMTENDVIITSQFLSNEAHDASDVIREIERQAKLDTAPQSSHRPR